MKAVIVKEFAPIENAVYEDIEAQSPDTGEVIVDIHAVDANFPDILVMEGLYQVKPPLPFSPGKGCAGVVSAIGAGVDNVNVGDRVLLHVEYGAYTEQLKTAASNCFPIPDDMPFDVAAALGMVYQTSHFALVDRAGFKAGDTVLVLGASGGIGMAAVQLAKAMGAKKVIGGARGAEKMKIAKEMGCDDVIDMSMDNLRDGLRQHVNELTDNNGVDIVIDPVGGDVLNAALRAMAWRGRLVVVGFAAGDIPVIKANYLLVKNISVSGIQWSDYRDKTPDWMRRVQNEIFDYWVAGKLNPLISKTLPLSQFGDALQALKKGGAYGKIILTTQGDA